ncbi:MAG: TAXI family TRAP transporter solute-binding subunit [Sneathiella sp.]|nr:TAXI family TRAP transporter solute-binding subunit [Sneathiella sp.]
MYSTILRMYKLVALVAATLMLSAGSYASEQDNQPLTLISDTILSGGYNQARLIRDSITPALNQRIQLVTNPDKLAQINALSTGQAHACFCGPTAYLAQEGLSGFDDIEAGPQPIRLLLSSSGSFAMTFLVDDTIADKNLNGLRGKRVAWLRKDHQYNFHTTALLSYFGITWQDVQQIVFPDYNAAVEGFERNYVDALLVLSSDPSLARLLSGKRNFALARFSTDNKSAISRMQSVAPYLTPQQTPPSGSISGISGITFPYPNLIATDKLSEQKAYELTRAIIEQFDSFADSSTAAEGWNILFQNFFGSIPFHAGSVKYFKELNLWSPEAEAHRNNLLERQNYLKQVFNQQKQLRKENQDFRLQWRNAREAALIARQADE